VVHRLVINFGNVGGGAVNESLYGWGAFFPRIGGVSVASSEESVSAKGVEVLEAEVPD
jgi:hypothetical protein